MEYVTLANGVKMPQLGYGLYQVTKDECERCVADALSVGYRHIDTAQSYFNEEEVGNAIKKSGIPRNTCFCKTQTVIGAAEQSNGKLLFQRVDLLHDRGGRDVQIIRRLSKTANFRNFDKCFQPPVLKR